MELQIITTVGCNIPIRILKNQNTYNTECCEEHGTAEMSCTASGNEKWCSQFGRQLGIFFNLVKYTFVILSCEHELVSIYLNGLKM
jgi:hypothetical protein